MIILSGHIVLTAEVNVTITGLFPTHPLYVTGIQYVLPAFELAIREITVADTLNVTFAPLYSNEIATCVDIMRFYYLVAEYYYTKWDGNGYFVIIGGGCEEVDLLAQLARGQYESL